MQRQFTKSQFDHVSMILRYEEGLHLLERKPEKGVILTPWENFIAKEANTSYITYIYIYI